MTIAPLAADPDAGPIIAAVITASVAVVVAVLTAALGLLRLRADRAYTRRVAAVRDLQDRSLVLRYATRRYGLALKAAARGADPGEVAGRTARLAAADAAAAAEDALFRATGAVEVAASRIDDAEVIRRHAAWLSDASIYFLDPEEVTASQEDQAWRSFNEAVSAALASADGVLRRGPRA